MKKAIGQYCKEYRESKGIGYKELETDIHFRTLISFERGMSSNLLNLVPYLLIAESNNERMQFLEEIGDILCK